MVQFGSITVRGPLLPLYDMPSSHVIVEDAFETDTEHRVNGIL